jgi:uncharacterized surface protein with fasciclin (FAS1) repeats
VSNPTANLTVFAPNDRAFVRLARDLGFTGTTEAAAWQFLVGALTQLGNGDPIPVLTNVLLYHFPDVTLREAKSTRRGEGNGQTNGHTNGNGQTNGNGNGPGNA